jgi:hypothetical protein
MAGGQKREEVRKEVLETVCSGKDGDKRVSMTA